MTLVYGKRLPRTPPLSSLFGPLICIVNTHDNPYARWQAVKLRIRHVDGWTSPQGKGLQKQKTQKKRKHKEKESGAEPF